jgi:hypothetical protein
MAQGKGGGGQKSGPARNDDRVSSKKKAYKKRPKVWDPEKRRLVTGPSLGK